MVELYLIQDVYGIPRKYDRLDRFVVNTQPTLHTPAVANSSSSRSNAAQHTMEELAA